MRKVMITTLLVLAACGESTSTTSSVPPTSDTTSNSISSSTAVGPTSPETTVTDSRSIEVTIPAQGLDLAGTLRLPSGEEPAPAVVLIHGSGPQSRDSRLPGQLNMAFGFEILVFAEIATALQEAGVAVLTYDKRSCGPFNGCADNGYPRPEDTVTVQVFIDDAQASVDFLRQRTEVDPGRISIVGHSQGAQFITLMVEEDPELASGVMIAGPYRSVDEITRAQLDSTIELLGQLGIDKDDALAMPTVTPLVDMVDGLADIRSGNNEPVAGVSAEFWRSWFDLHERSLSSAARITQPLLVLNGEYDWNIPPSEAQAWADYLVGVGADFELLTFPCVTHALNCVSEPDPTAISPMDIGSTVAPEVIDALVAFLVG